MSEVKKWVDVLSDLDQLDAFADLIAAEKYEGELLTHQQLAELLDVDLDPEGVPIDINEYINACLHIGGSPGYELLENEARIQALASAAGALEQLVYGANIP